MPSPVPGVVQRMPCPRRSLLLMLTLVMPRRGARKGLWLRQATRRARPCWTCARRQPRRLTGLHTFRRTHGA
eukprot:13825777-Alexandrium_andersonii.AAC.1